MWNQKSLKLLLFNDSVSKWCFMLGEFGGTERREADQIGGGGRLTYLSQMASLVPGGHCTLCLYSIFSKKWTALHFPIGDSRLGLCVSEGGERRRVWTQSHKKHKHSRIHDHQLFQVNELWNMQLLFPPSSLPFVVGKEVQRKLGQEQAKSKRKKEKKRRTFLKGEVGKETGY